MKTNNSNKKLYIIFFSLLVIVIGLLIGCIIKNNEADKNKYANMIIPIYETGSNFEFSINAKLLSEASKYTFKIVNYRKNKINKENISYQIEVKNNTNSKVHVYIDNSKKDLIKKQKTTIFDKKTLDSSKKEDIYYTVKISSYKDLKSDDMIYIRVFN